MVCIGNWVLGGESGQIDHPQAGVNYPPRKWQLLDFLTIQIDNSLAGANFSFPSFNNIILDPVLLSGLHHQLKNIYNSQLIFAQQLTVNC
jgi:hypothetical protein